MGRPRFITPDSAPSATKVCRGLTIPDDEQYVALVLGALVELIFPYNWEQVSGISADDAAAAFYAIYNSFGACRVIGEIIPYAGSTSPDANWLVCNGASLLRSSYPELFSVIGTAYGSVDGTHFNIPDGRGRALLGSGQGTGLTNRSLGTTVGTEQHTLGNTEMPVHSHLIVHPANIPFAVTPGPTPIVSGYVAESTGTAGGGGAHNNMQPSLAINYLIVAKNP